MACISHVCTSICVDAPSIANPKSLCFPHIVHFVNYHLRPFATFRLDKAEVFYTRVSDIVKLAWDQKPTDYHKTTLLGQQMDSKLHA